MLAETFYEEMKRIPTPEYTEEEIAFAEKISEEAGIENQGEYSQVTGTRTGDKGWIIKSTWI